MKIAFLSRFQNEIERGAENFVLEIAKRLSQKHTVDIFSGKASDNIEQIKKGGYNIVIPINGRMQSLRVSLGRISGKYKLLITGHSGMGRDDIWNIAVCRPDAFVALTDYMADWARKWAIGVKVAKIANGVDLKRFTQEGPKLELGLPRPIILSVGALVWYKHHGKIIRALSKGAKGSLLIVGKGEEEEKLKQEGERLLGERFKIANFNYEDMPKVYRSADIFTLPSWDREAFGMVYLEAMASGLGVVAPDDPPRREIIGDGGILTDVNNALTYSEALIKALGSNLSDRARKQAEKFSWEKAADEYEKLMSDMINI